MNKSQRWITKDATEKNTQWEKTLDYCVSCGDSKINSNEWRAETRQKKMQDGK